MDTFRWATCSVVTIHSVDEYRITDDAAKSRSIRGAAEFWGELYRRNRGGPVMDLEDKPRPPPQVPSRTPTGLDENLDPPDESPPAQARTNTSIQPRSGRSTAKKKTAKSKPLRKKIKAPDSETEDRGDLMSDDQLTKAYYKKELVTGYEVPLLAYTVVAGGSFNNEKNPSVGFGVKSTLFIFGTAAAAIRLLVNHSNPSRYRIG
ncbi:unnamed protein product [Phytophthora fragariaefolia]|uniref:Unnamed protein product n=1 Tax=Phytophthora fragariaefolia TaxID=1490495 RepID=A0A9W6YE60_9STRA|nr:unnamed protein product [Phytophthora fragariaefolia]